MRILRLCFRNLNSLADTWEIDFTHPTFTGDGIFAITGPTGAGKSTILDAICLALYGRTPRLDKITKSGNEIMSRQSGECSAEIEFVAGGGRYRCSWHQHKSRRKADGQLQPPKRELSLLDNGQILASSINEVARKVEECTGMDFDRFTRSMLLAQGGFAAFLQATQDERAPILEQITGSGIYTAISKQVHVRFTDERREKEKLEAQAGATQLLDSDEEATIRQELDRERLEATRLGKEIDRQATALAWLTKINALEEELAKIKKERGSLHQEQEDFAEEKKQLMLAQRALLLEGDHAQLISSRNQQQQDREAAETLRCQLPKAETDLAGAEKKLIDNSTAAEKSRETQELEHKRITQVRALDLRIREKDALIEKDRAEQAALEQKNTLEQEQCDQGSRQISSAEISRKEKEKYRAEHTIDQQLVAELTGLRRVFERLTELDQQHGLALIARKKADNLLLTRQQEWQERMTLCSAAEKQLEEKAQQRQAIQEKINGQLNGRTIEAIRKEESHLIEQRALLDRILEIVRQKEQLGQEIKKLHSRRESLTADNQAQAVTLKLLKEELNKENLAAAGLRTQVAFANRIRDLEEERQRLQDHSPCPLCGSVEHPYAQGNIPALDTVEQELQAALILVQEVEKALSTAKIQAARDEKEAEGLVERVKQQEETVREAEQLIRTSCQEFNQLAQLPKKGGLEPSQAALTDRLTALNQELESNQRQMEALAELDRQLDKVVSALEEQRHSAVKAGSEQEKATHAKEKAEQEQQRLHDQGGELAQRLVEHRIKAAKEVEQYGIEEAALQPERMEHSLTQLSCRRDQWLANQQELETIEKEITALQTESKELRAGIDTRSKQIKAEERAIKENSDERRGLAEERFHLFADKEADAAEKQLAEAVRLAEKSWRKAQEDHAQLLKERDLSKAAVNSKERDIAERKEPLKQLEADFRQRLKENTFADETTWLAARIPEKERTTLSDRNNALRTRRTQLDERLHDRQTRLVEAEKLQLSKQEKEPLRQEHAALILEQGRTTEKIGSLNQSLLADEQRRTQQEDLLRSLTAQKKEYRRWQNLHELIGSADGKKYRNFAQGLTFELMVSHANRQLTQMTDRYLLVRDKKQPLELNVIDAWQAGEIRSTKNLSGGESFVVSLALALGLSNMVGGTVRVDSLFLDEGFGALDDDALETALETLAGLRREGKLIGVISHVAALKERIACRLEVVPEAGGRSVVLGAGVRRVE